MKQEKIVMVRKHFQWVKCFDWLNNKIVRKRLCKLVPIGHKVLIKFDERKIATELFDLTMMFGSNKNVPNLKDFKKAYFVIIGAIKLTTSSPYTV